MKSSRISRVWMKEEGSNSSIIPTCKYHSHYSESCGLFLHSLGLSFVPYTQEEESLILRKKIEVGWKWGENSEIQEDIAHKICLFWYHSSDSAKHRSQLYPFFCLSNDARRDHCHYFFLFCRHSQDEGPKISSFRQRASLFGDPSCWTVWSSIRIYFHIQQQLSNLSII